LTISVDSTRILSNKQKTNDSFGTDNLKEFLPGVMKNPYFPDDSAVIVGSGETYQWFYNYKGKVIYFPKEKGKFYIIYGSTDTGFIDLVLHSAN
ncbi:unnamed protein product, partial [marine sediment metagenome]